jgi:hypothetical protein
MLKENKKLNQANFNLSLELSSILSIFEKEDQKKLEATQVNLI